MTPNFVHIIYSIYTTKPCGWDLYNLVTFTSTRLQKQWCIFTWKSRGLEGLRWTEILEWLDRGVPYTGLSVHPVQIHLSNLLPGVHRMLFVNSCGWFLCSDSGLEFIDRKETSLFFLKIVVIDNKYWVETVVLFTSVLAVLVLCFSC